MDDIPATVPTSLTKQKLHVVLIGDVEAEFGPVYNLLRNCEDIVCAIADTGSTAMLLLNYMAIDYIELLTLRPQELTEADHQLAQHAPVPHKRRLPDVVIVDLEHLHSSRDKPGQPNEGWLGWNQLIARYREACGDSNDFSTTFVVVGDDMEELEPLATAWDQGIRIVTAHFGELAPDQLVGNVRQWASQQHTSDELREEHAATG